jgi:mannose/fructose/N-acetylgalactosamine-specific phosphotransferase system component IIC
MVEILIWVVAIFAAGSFLVLERRCLGQRALVQPLVLCLTAGWVVGNVQAGLWFGVTLQLFSVAPSRGVDWALSSAVASSALLTSDYFNIHLEVGRPESTVLMLVTVLAGMAAHRLERHYARRDREKVEKHPPWHDADPVWALEKTVYRATSRWFLFGGLEVVAGLAIALIAMKGIAQFRDIPKWGIQISAISLPAVGSAVTVSALTGRHFIIWAGASACGAIAFLFVVAS